MFLRIFCLAIIFLVGVQALNTVKIFDYPPKLDVQLYPFQLAKKNAENFILEIKKTTENLLIFPEYSLTTLAPVNVVKGHLNDYSFPELKTGTKFCDSPTKDDNEEALKLISCAALENKKDIVFHVVEKTTDNFYSTVAHIDKTGTLQNKHRKEITVDELAVSASPSNSRIFNINNEDYIILMGYEPIFVEFNQQWKNLIYFPNSKANIPILFNLLPKAKNDLNIYQLPTQISREPNFNLNITYSELNKNLDDCKVEYKATDEASVKTNYKIATYSGPIPFGNSSKNIKICGLISTTGATSDFENIKIFSNKNNFIVGGAKSVNGNREPIESSKIVDSTATMAENVQKLEGYGIVESGAEIAKLNYLFMITILVALLFSH